MPDRHTLWRRVQFDYEQMVPLAPDGYEPFIQVFLAGRPEPIEPAFVETHRDVDDPWVRFQILGADIGADKANPESYWMHVHEQLVQRVELHFRRVGRTPTGFTYTEKEPSPS